GVPTPARQCLQGPLGAQRHGPHAVGSRRGAIVSTITRINTIGLPLDRVEGPAKVTGTATFAFEQPVDRPAYLYPLQATIAAGRLTGIDTSAASAESGVLAVFTHENAPKLASTDDGELAILQSNEVAYRGQLVGGVVAETSE